MMLDNYITLSEYAAKNNLLPSAVRRKCIRETSPAR